MSILNLKYISKKPSKRTSPFIAHGIGVLFEFRQKVHKIAIGSLCFNFRSLVRSPGIKTKKYSSK